MSQQFPQPGQSRFGTPAEPGQSDFGTPAEPGQPTQPGGQFGASQPGQFGQYGQMPSQQWSQQPLPNPRSQQTDVFAILGLVGAFVFAPAGIVLSAIGLSRIKRDGSQGRGLALAGLIIAIISTLLGLLGLIMIFVIGAAATDSIENAAGEAVASSNLYDLAMAMEQERAATGAYPTATDGLPLPYDAANSTASILWAEGDSFCLMALDYDANGYYMTESGEVTTESCS
ncbi:MAG TPA: DUF4190 domain-containing protein [Actinomycetales bacterium]|nr:DUF4190 domain-containing protein [Actinomycetales bacterium]